MLSVPNQTKTCILSLASYTAILTTTYTPSHIYKIQLFNIGIDDSCFQLWLNNNRGVFMW